MGKLKYLDGHFNITNNLLKYISVTKSDVLDAWAMFAEYVQQLEGNNVEVFRRPF